MDLAAVGADRAAQSFAVHGDLDQFLLLRLMVGAFAQGGADGGVKGVAVEALEDAAEGGLGRRLAGKAGFGVEDARSRTGGPVARQIGGPLGNRGQGTSAGQDRAGGQGEDIGQRVTASPPDPRVGNPLKGPEQGGYVRFREVSAEPSWTTDAGIGEDAGAGTAFSVTRELDTPVITGGRTCTATGDVQDPLTNYLKSGANYPQTNGTVTSPRERCRPAPAAA
ncbi:hypothetical protein [Streptomyces sp. SID685]|uniref:hypothetical protein n=1 Tax=Streptomyces sp. SID685 TaxID=2690322 RepID=UPI001F1E64D0|nr:hypothetical protein [Streptomyces sp. SID685]